MADVEKYLKSARRAREDGLAEDAKKFYEMVRMEDPENLEAKFFYTCSNFWSGTKGAAKANYSKTVTVTRSVLGDISRLDSTEVTEDIRALLLDMYKELKRMTAVRDITFSMEKYEAIPVFETLGDFLELHSKEEEEYISCAVGAWSTADLYCFFPIVHKPEGVDLDKIVAKIRKYVPEYESAKEQNERKAAEEAKAKAVAAEEAKAKAKAKAKVAAAEEAKARKKGKIILGVIVAIVVLYIIFGMVF